MALQQCPKQAGAQGLLQRLQCRNNHCNLVLGTQRDIVGWGWFRGWGEGTRDSPAVLQHPFPGQVLCVCQERGAVKDGLEWGVCVFMDA